MRSGMLQRLCQLQRHRAAAQPDANPGSTNHSEGDWVAHRDNSYMEVTCGTAALFVVFRNAAAMDVRRSGQA